jgi:serine/threonine protein kinase
LTGHDPEGEDTRFDPGKRLGGLTPAYASLEMWAREEPDPRDDIYAFACVIYQLLAGKHPFGSKSARAVRDEKLTPKRIDSLTRAQWDALRKGLALHRDARIPTVGELIAPFAPSSFVRRHLLSMTAAAAAVVLGALTIGAHLYRGYIEEETIGVIDDGPAPPHNTVLTPEQKQDVEGKLDLAQVYFDSVTPDLTPAELVSALSDGPFGVTQILDDVLKTDPGNPAALKLRRKVVDIYSRKARQLADAGDVKNASQLANAGLRLQPRHRALFLLRRDLCSKDATACR